MGPRLAKVLGTTPEGLSRLGEEGKRLKTLAEFLKEAVKAASSTGVIEAISSATPWWLDAVGSAAAESLAPIKFIGKLCEKLGEITDPDKLAYLACTLAYQRSAEQAFRAVGPPSSVQSPDEWVPPRDVDGPDDGMNFQLFSLKSPLSHDFVHQSDAILLAAAGALGYDEAGGIRLQGEVHMRFAGNLKRVLTDPSSRSRFLPFSDRLRLDNVEDRVRSAWDDHADYQRRLFEEKPVFGEEPFALGDIYVETECGKLTWEEITKGRASATKSKKEQGTGSPRGGEDRRGLDPFSENNGGRHDLVGTVIELIKDKTFRDAVIVQGPAGSGKSAFTVRMCVELQRLGLRPIRIRFRDLKTTTNNIDDGLAEVVRFWDEDDRPDEVPPAEPRELFLNGILFDESVRVGEAPICPWVLILDGWDEVSVASNKGFAVRIDELLTQIRDRFLSRPNRPLVRVILTGRPSDAVMRSRFLKNETVVLTIRPLRPEQVRTHVRKLAVLLAGNNKGAAMPERFEPVLEEYAEGFDGYLKEESVARHSMEVLGLPLLAHLAVHLMVNWHDPDLRRLVANPTTLYRHLADVTCGKGAKYGKDTAQSAVPIPSIRALLRETAAAMTAFGSESIPYEELEARLSEERSDLMQSVAEATSERPITALMVNFYFKGGRPELGAEFTHKGFREYLFAEAVIEALKDYGRLAPDNLVERSAEHYWKEFPTDDVRFQLTRRLGRLLAPNWITTEVAGHLNGLLEWEIERGRSAAASSGPGEPTQPLNLTGWVRVRDGLADLWDWWGEGVHLRPQPVMKANQRLDRVEQPFVVDLVRWTMAQEPEKGNVPQPPRVVTMDAHLGDALCRLTSLVHHHLVVRAGEEPDWDNEANPGNAPRSLVPRRYQSIGCHKGQWALRFRPSGGAPSYFMQYVWRIEAAGFRPEGRFPCKVVLAGTDLSESWLTAAAFAGCDLRAARLRSSFLLHASFYQSQLQRADFRPLPGNEKGTTLGHADFIQANVDGANFEGIIDLEARNFDWALNVEKARGIAPEVIANARKPAERS